MKPGELGILRQELESYDLLTMASVLELLRRIGKRDISVNESTLSQMFHAFLELQRSCRPHLLLEENVAPEDNLEHLNDLFLTLINKPR